MGDELLHPAGPSGRNLEVFRLNWIVALVFLGASPVWAHDPGLSTTQIDVRTDGLVAAVGFAPRDIRALLPALAQLPSSAWGPADFATAKPGLLALGRGLIEVRDTAGIVHWARDDVTLASGNSIIFTLSAARRPQGITTVRSLVMNRLPPGHRDYVSINDEKGVLISERLVGAGDEAVSFDLPRLRAVASVERSEPPTFWGFLRLGIAHIWTGYDHLLFLFGLLVVCRSFRSIVGIISCFTVAHSITLALATLNIVNIPSSVIEPMIAASIFYVGVENLIRRGAEPKGRWAITFAFGLIHGFGFASVLRELGIGSNGHGLAMPLFTFNLGVEIGQVSIALLVLPIVWQLRKNPTFVRRGVPILSALVALAGLYWFLQRTLFSAS
jgi:hydrogenase/urease accessory protein HupE